MRYRIPLLFLIVLAVIALSGCDELSLDGVALPLGGSTTAEASASPAKPLATLELPSDGGRISIYSATDELLAGYDEYLDLSWVEEGQMRLAFTSSVLVRNFSIIELSYEDSELYPGRAIIAQKELLPSRPLIVSWLEQGAVSNRGISFVDEGGVTRYFVLETDHEEAHGKSIALREF